MNKFICIHGHFYQPPRENAWLEEIEIQDSAYPYHDWNLRITEECYGPNAVSRILDDESKIVDIVNNYARISFNFGATLLSWMEKYAPKVYQAILEGDLESQKRYNGHGSALAQVYNHIIMPLANRRDKETQVIWGLKDFEYRFKRKAEGMWLAETAVDIETLEVLAENGIKFTILAPRQAKRFRKIGSEDWYEGVITRKHYICKLPSGKSIVLFFYDGHISEAVAFKGLLNDGRKFANYLSDAFDNREQSYQLVHIATDGESYGHHHRHGDMALAFCLEHLEKNNLARLTNYSEFLSLFEPEYEMEIYENSSWSCVHGVERWRNNCGCNTGGRPHWNQEWRSPLRSSLDWLRDALIKVYEEEMAVFNDNPWELRNQYIEVILDRSRENAEKFIQKNTKSALSPLAKTQFMRLVEMQRQALLMFTSCAWFFDEVTGIETVQVLQYANRAIQLAEVSQNIALEATFLEKLQAARSNTPEFKNAKEVYANNVSPSRLSLTKVGMHYAVACLFAESPESVNLHILNYECISSHFERWEAGVQKLAVGRTTVKSNITLSEKYFSFAVIYLGQHHIIGASSSGMSSQNYFMMVDKLKSAFAFGNIAEVLETMEVYFNSKKFSIWELFRDERIKVMNQVLETSITSVEESYLKIFNRNYNIINAMNAVGLRIPSILKQNLDMVLNTDLETFFEKKSTNIKRLRHLCDEIAKWQVPLDYPKLSFVASHCILELLEQYMEDTSQSELLRKINEILHYTQKLHIVLNLNEIQNTLFKLSKKDIPQWYVADSEILKVFLDICRKTNMKIKVNGQLH